MWRFNSYIFITSALLLLVFLCNSNANGGLLQRHNSRSRYLQSFNNNSISDEESENHRQSKLLNFLFVVRFANDPCNGTNGLQGTCYTSAQCSSRGGSEAGKCAQNYGVCCTFILQTCGNSSSENCTYFQNPGFPSTYNMAQTCTVFISRRSDDICQFKFDFLTFNVQPPNAGACNMDRFTISGQNGNSFFPSLCGLNTGQSAFADVSFSQGPIILSMTTVGTFSRSWNIKVTQIRCGDSNLAPANCLQYLTGASGTLKSFNYDTTAPAAAVGYINDLRYSICIRKEMGFCTITFTNADTSTFAIQSTGPAATEAGTGLVECPNDFILLASNRYCANRLNPSTATTNPTVNAPVIEMTNGPFVVDFVSDATTVARGFMLSYLQSACIMG